MNSSLLSPSVSLSRPMTDPFGRTISYLRVSVTDRCDLRCFIACRRHDIPAQGRSPDAGGTRPAVLGLHRQGRAQAAADRRRAAGPAQCDVAGALAVAPSEERSAQRVDADHQRFATGAFRRPNWPTAGFAASTCRWTRWIRRNSAPITRWGDLDKVLAGIEAARAAGLAVKINAVALKNLNEDEIPALMQWAHAGGMALTLIEVMPMGDIGEGRIDQYVPLSLVRARLAKQYTLTDLDEDTGGPARYVGVGETGGKLGFITPMTHNFLRVLQPRPDHLHRHAAHLPRPRGCLGSAQAAAGLRRRRTAFRGDRPRHRPEAEGHDFIIDRRHNRPSVSRHMSVTGG